MPSRSRGSDGSAASDTGHPPQTLKKMSAFAPVAKGESSSSRSDDAGTGQAHLEPVAHSEPTSVLGGLAAPRNISPHPPTTTPGPMNVMTLVAQSQPTMLPVRCLAATDVPPSVLWTTVADPRAASARQREIDARHGHRYPVSTAEEKAAYLGPKGASALDSIPYLGSYQPRPCAEDE